VKIKKADTSVLEGDMTPMIDMTFQLIAFLMVLVNFTADDVSAKVILPESELARPPEGAPAENRIIVQVDAEGRIIMGADQNMSLDGMKTMLSNEAFLLQSKDLSPSDALIIIRAHHDAQTGKVQEIIKACQEKKFDRFVLRAKEKGA
jgi:biopolymer transport protein ExbD